MFRKFLMVGLFAAFSFPAHAEIVYSPIGAAAACNDGTFSTSSGSGTCSGHGGVLRALTAQERSGAVPFQADQSSALVSQTAVASYVSVGDEADQSTGTMPTTGGAPLSMIVLGASSALGALALRRRI